MKRIIEKLILGCYLNDMSKIHDCDSVAEMVNDTEIVGNEDVCESPLLLQFLHQVEYLGLYRHIKSRYRFITYDEFRPECQRTCNTDSLSLPS